MSKAAYNRSYYAANRDQILARSRERYWSNRERKSGLPVAERMAHRTEKSDGCWLWIGYLAGGYGRLKVNGRLVAAHRIAWELAYGPIPDGLCVCHRCDNRACVRPDHLFLGTNADNMQDMANKGRHGECRGDLNGRAKLTLEQVSFVRANPDITQAELAGRFGVNQTTISRIRRGEGWRVAG